MSTNAQWGLTTVIAKRFVIIRLDPLTALARMVIQEMEPHVLVCYLTVYIFCSGDINCFEVKEHNLGFQFECPIKVKRSKKADVIWVAVKRICSENYRETAIMT